MSTSLSGGQLMKMTRAIIHEKFRMESEFEYDVAIVSLNEEITFAGKSQKLVTQIDPW